MKLIKLALKTLSKFRLYTAINIVGLTMSLACGMILIRYIHQELTVDHFVKDLDRTYILIKEYHNQPRSLGSNSNPNNDAGFLDPLDDPSVETYTVYIPYQQDYLMVDQQRYSVKTMITDSAFLQILPFPVLAGTVDMQAPDQAVLSEQLAKRIFGNADPLGKTFVYSTGQTLTVAGIIGEPSTKTSFVFDLIVSHNLQQHWGRVDFNLVRLYPGTDMNALNKKNENFMNLSYSWNIPVRMQLFPLEDLYFDHTIERSYLSDIFIQGNYNIILILIVVTTLLFVVGLFNYINIYTVLMQNRAREFGVKKVYGANGWRIFFQIWVENIFLTLISLLLVWVVIELTGGLLESELSIPIRSNLLFDVQLSLSVLFIFPVLATIHPAIKYSYALPITSLRSVDVGGKSVVSRTVFLYLQYLVTFCMLVVSIFFVKQLNFMLNADQGYNTKNIVKCAFLSNNHDDANSYEETVKKSERDQHTDQVIKQKLAESLLFQSWTKGEFLHNLTPYYSFKKEDGEFQKVAYASLTSQYMEMFGFQLLEGRLWDTSVDEWSHYKIIINESAKKLFDINDISREQLQPERRLWYSSEIGDMSKNPPYEIVGVIKDFKTNHLSKANVPLVIVYEPYPSKYDPVIAQIRPGKRGEAIKFLKELYTEAVGAGDFNYSFLEDEIAALYEEDKRITSIYMLFSLIAIIISCLGLFGLSLFDIRQRYREIALRKVNGATVKNIMPLLLKKYSYTIIGSLFIAVPLSYWIIQKYLEDFAYKAPVSWWIFVVSAAIVLGISYLTLIWQIRKVIRINPAEVIKSE